MQFLKYAVVFGWLISLICVCLCADSSTKCSDDDKSHLLNDRALNRTAAVLLSTEIATSIDACISFCCQNDKCNAVEYGVNVKESNESSCGLFVCKDVSLCEATAPSADRISIVLWNFKSLNAVSTETTNSFTTTTATTHLTTTKSTEMDIDAFSKFLEKAGIAQGQLETTENPVTITDKTQPDTETVTPKPFLTETVGTKTETPTPEIPVFTETPTPEIPVFTETSTPEIPFFTETPTPEIPVFTETPTPEIPVFTETPTPEIPVFTETPPEISVFTETPTETPVYYTETPDEAFFVTESPATEEFVTKADTAEFTVTETEQRPATITKDKNFEWALFEAFGNGQLADRGEEGGETMWTHVSLTMCALGLTLFAILCLLLACFVFKPQERRKYTPL